MPTSIQITLTTVGNSIGPTFDLYCIDSSGVVSSTPFDQGVSLASLQAGYNVFVSNTCTAVRVQSIGSCTTYTDISIVFITTTTTSTTSTTTSTTTAPGVPIILGFDEGVPVNICETAAINFVINPTTYYLAPGCSALTFIVPCDILYIDPYLTSVAPDGIYSDGVNCYQIKSGSLNDEFPVPATTTTTTTSSSVRPPFIFEPITMYDCSGLGYVYFINQGEPLQPGTHIYTSETLTEPIPDGLYDTMGMSVSMYILVGGVIQEGLVDCYS
jgi:hypothetical protein